MEHRSTGFSANMMMLGMEVFQPIAIVMRTVGTHYQNEDPTGYVQHLRKTLQDVHTLASTKLRTQLKYLGNDCMTSDCRRAIIRSVTSFTASSSASKQVK